MLNRSKDQDVNQAIVEERGRVLETALAAHGVETRLVGMVVGPTVTRYELELGPGVKVAKVTSLNKDIAYAMASPDVRILAPIPGRQAIGVEVPNTDRAMVALGDILASAEARRSTGALEVAVGRDINGKPILMDLSKMPHILIAGATGAGKSSCINSIVTSILMRSTPDQVRMISDRSQDGRDDAVRACASPADPAGRRPEEGCQRPPVGVPRDGPPLRAAVRGRLPRHRRLQRCVRQGHHRNPAGEIDAEGTPRPTLGCRSFSSSSTSSPTS